MMQSHTPSHFSRHENTSDENSSSTPFAKSMTTTTPSKSKGLSLGGGVNTPGKQFTTPGKSSGMTMTPRRALGDISNRKNIQPNPNGNGGGGGVNTPVVKKILNNAGATPGLKSKNIQFNIPSDTTTNTPKIVKKVKKSVSGKKAGVSFYDEFAESSPEAAAVVGKSYDNEIEFSAGRLYEDGKYDNGSYGREGYGREVDEELRDIRNMRENLYNGKSSGSSLKERKRQQQELNELEILKQLDLLAFSNNRKTNKNGIDDFGDDDGIGIGLGLNIDDFGDMNMNFSIDCDESIGGLD